MDYDAGSVRQRVLEHWIVKDTVVGLNGLSCPWLKREWKWKNGKTCREETLTLTREETKKWMETTTEVRND